MKHCWHSTSKVLLSHPPLNVDRCCWCGKERSYPQYQIKPSTGHGQYGSPEIIVPVTEPRPFEDEKCPNREANNEEAQKSESMH